MGRLLNLLISYHKVTTCFKCLIKNNTQYLFITVKIRQERKIELLYEHQRFSDIRTWMIARQVLSTNALGAGSRYKLGMSKPTYTFISVRDRAWKDWSYFMPVKLDEMNRNKRLAQNPLYSIL